MDFQLHGGDSAPNPHIAQGSTVFMTCKKRKNPFLFLLYIVEKFNTKKLNYLPKSLFLWKSEIIIALLETILLTIKCPESLLKIKLEYLLPL